MNRPLLIVDDDLDYLIVLTRWFIQRGYHPVSVTHPRQALEAARVQPFQAALIDASLLDMDGLELMHRLKRSQNETEVVILSDYEYPVEQAIAAGAIACLVKPCQQELLEAIIEQAFERNVFESPARRPAVPDRVSVATRQ